MEKLKLHSKDVTAGNIRKLAELFPNCLTEVKDNDPRNLSSSFIIHHFSNTPSTSISSARNSPPTSSMARRNATASTVAREARGARHGEHQSLQRRIALLTAKVNREKQFNRRVALNQELKPLQAELENLERS